MGKKEKTEDGNLLDYLIDVEFAPLPKLRPKSKKPTVETVDSDSELSEDEYTPIALLTTEKSIASDSGYVSRGEVKTSTPKKSGAPSIETEMNCNERALVPVQKKPVACTNDNSRISFQLTVSGKRINFDISDLADV